MSAAPLPAPEQAPVQPTRAIEAFPDLVGTDMDARPPPAMAAAPVMADWLVLISRDGGEGPAYPLTDQLDLGRTEGEVLMPDDAYVSPRHARIRKRDGAYVLADLGSTNGVYQRIRPMGRSDVAAKAEIALEDHDVFLAGQQVLKFEFVRDADAGLGAASRQGTLVFGSPSTPRYARLTQRTVEGVPRDVYYIRKVETVLGRESCDIVFAEDPFLSRRHVAVRFDREQRKAYLADLGSSNGTFLKIRGEVQLTSGDQFRIGQQLFRVELGTTRSPSK